MSDIENGESPKLAGSGSYRDAREGLSPSFPKGIYKGIEVFADSRNYTESVAAKADVNGCLFSLYIQAQNENNVNL